MAAYHLKYSTANTNNHLNTLTFVQMITDRYKQDELNF